MNKKVVILGAGGHAKSIADIVLKSNDQVIGFLDDNVEIGTAIIKSRDIKVIGKIEDSLNIANNQNILFVIGIGNNKVREKIAKQYNIKYYTAIHPTAVIAQDVQIEEGTVVMANTVINVGASIGKHCIINTGAIVEHDNTIEDYVHLSPSVVLSGTVKIGKYTHLGTGTKVRNNINITANVIIGVGGVVVKDINKEGTYVGVPVKRLEK